jgi:hypothetical protein
MPQVGQTGPYSFIAGSSVKVGAGRSAFCGTFPGSPPLGVTQRPALWSPDFPPSGTHFNNEDNAHPRIRTVDFKPQGCFFSQLKWVSDSDNPSNSIKNRLKN